MFTVLQRNWKSHLAELLHNARTEILISSPYITRLGTDFISENVSSSVCVNGSPNILTDLSPLNICQGSIDPAALRSLVSEMPNTLMWHLPRLHAKVYIADRNRAIVTSGNLTAGGLALNYEYGMETSHTPTVQLIHHDITAYANLGANITNEQLATYCEIADQVRIAFRKQQTSVTRSIRQEFARALRGAEDELVRLRLIGGAVHTVFAKTILYLLSRHGPMATERLNSMVEMIHPDLCDNTIDRVIDGKRFGKKWKHAVRTAQQNLKKRGLITLGGGRWTVTDLGREAENPSHKV